MPRRSDLHEIMSTAILTAAAPVRFPFRGLKHPQLAALDRKLEVLHVVVVSFEFLSYFDELV